MLTASLLLYRRSVGTIGAVGARVTVTTTLRDDAASPIYAGCGKFPPEASKMNSLYLPMAREELAAKSVYRLMPRLTKEEFCQKMSNFGDQPEGRIAQAYASWLLLRRMPPSREKAKHWEEMTSRLRETLAQKENGAAGSSGESPPFRAEQNEDEPLQ